MQSPDENDPDDEDDPDDENDPEARENGRQGLGRENGQDQREDQRPTVAVLGAGFAGLWASDSDLWPRMPAPTASRLQPLGNLLVSKCSHAP